VEIRLYIIIVCSYFKPLSAKISSKVQSESAPRLPASSPLITFQFYPFVVSLSDMQERVHFVHARHLALKGLSGITYRTFFEKVQYILFLVGIHTKVFVTTNQL